MNRTANRIDMKKRLCALLCAAVLLLGVSAGAEEIATIGGCAYVDANKNLICDEGEQLMSGLPVRLYSWTGDDWVEVASVETDAYGYYSFAVGEEGEYCVRSSTTSADFSVTAVGENAYAAEDGADMESELLIVETGDTYQLDISLDQPAALEVTVFEDDNGDGKQGKYDSGVKGVLVEVMDGERVLANGESDKNGVVAIGSIKPGSYALRVTMPEGFGFHAKGEAIQEGESCLENNGQRVATSDTFDFVAGQTTRAGVGAMAVGTFSGKVFEDLNNDGVMDENDPGVAGVVLRLEGKKTKNVFELVSDETGEYSFDLLPTDTYIFTAQLPEGMMYARYSKTGGDLRSVFSGEVLSREFAVSPKKRQQDKNVGVIQNGALIGTAFFDVNYNGLWDEGESGYAGVTVEAIKVSNADSMGKTVTDENGSFVLAGLRGGDYRLRAVLPEDGSVFTVVPAEGGENANVFVQNKTRRETSVEPLNVQSGGETRTLIGVARGAVMEGVIFEDANYNGQLEKGEKTFSGVDVQLVDQDGNVVAQTKSAAKGTYTLKGIMPGTYTLKVKRTKNNGFTRLRPNEEGGSHIRELIDGYGVSDPMEIMMAQELKDVNAGMLPAGTVKGVLFHDANDNGIQDAEEMGMTNATVRLLSDDGEIDLVRPVALDGAYLFDGVMPGSYTITFQLPEHCEIATVASGGNTLANAGRETATERFTVAMAENYTYPLVGAVTLGNFAGQVFHDVNANGVQDDGEQLLSGAILTIKSGSDEQKLTTGKDGGFSFTDLRPDTYQLSLELPNGYISSSNTDTLTLQPRSVQTLDCSWDVLTDRQPKLIGAVQPASISGEIRLDENNDGNSTSDERMMTGMSVALIDEATGEVALETLTDDAGFAFDNVRPGVYTVRFDVPEQSEPARIKDSTFILSGGSMEQGGVAVVEGQQLSGLKTSLVSRTSIGGTLYLYDEAGRQPVANVTITLLQEGSASPMAATTSDENGAYRFDGLWPGDYRLKVELPSGIIFVRPGDANYPENASAVETEDGTSRLMSLKMAQHMLNENVLYIRTAKVGDLCWLDENQNGLLDGSERRLPGVKVQLLQNGEAVYETTTDAFGYYLFDAVYPGSYVLRASAYPEMTITAPVPSLRIISSCLTSGDGLNAQSDEFSVDSGSVRTDFDLGYVLLPGQQLPAGINDAPTRDWSAWNQQYTSMQD
ncbi:MAG: hypothetical protein E7319_10850 [Clostridiales bacterium]|nr:hypothetical protein [Clostridiales bacterium]